MLTPEQINEAATQLYQAECDQKQVRALTQRYPMMDLEDAYAIQQHWVNRKIADGQKIIGYKIGLTSRTMQQAMNIDTPDYGVLLDKMRFANGSEISASAFSDPRIEVEFAFVMKKPLFGEQVSIEQVIDATDYVIPALELIAARSYRTDPENGYIRTVYDTIADNAANAGVILGDYRIDPAQTDLRWAGALLYRNGEIEATGLAAGVMGHPAHGIRWVCKRFAPHKVGLEAGQVILSGSFTQPVIIKAGDNIRADYGQFGEIAIDIA